MKRLRYWLPFILLCLLSMVSCTESREEIVDYKVGSVLQYADMIALNKKFMDKTLDKKFSYGIETFVCKDFYEYSEPKDEIDSVLHDPSFGYTYAVLFDAFFPDRPSLRYFFAHKPSENGHTFVYLGVKDIPSEDLD